MFKSKNIKHYEEELFKNAGHYFSTFVAGRSTILP